ncbi:hypothetical protein [Nevskia sp.]|uniref:hypothetical protein n=1 Tax=Nevskia sp. TaxID=1929292 RepID=UPI0025E1C4AA|nr:hypothetical protein [Nevskia sp.]
MKPVRSPQQAPARLCVMRVQVEPARVWFHCPCCEAALEGFYCDPRGQMDVVCDDCGECFDIPLSAGLQLV